MYEGKSGRQPLTADGCVSKLDVRKLDCSTVSIAKLKRAKCHKNSEWEQQSFAQQWKPNNRPGGNGLIVLYSGSGSQEFEILADALASDDEAALMLTVRQALVARRYEDATELLDRYPFRLKNGTNDFNDDFYVLLAVVPLSEHERLRDPDNRAIAEYAANVIASVVTEFQFYVRFVVVQPKLLSPRQWDAFICYAGEDRADVAQPIYHRLESLGVRCWYDQGLILWGESVVAKINDGLEKSRYVIVVISESLLSKTWPTKEMHAALSMEIESGRNHVLPLYVGDDQQVRTMRSKLVLQRDKRYLRWTGHPEPVAVEFLEILRRDRDQ